LSPARLRLYLHTIRHLRASQIYWRLRHRLIRSTPDLAPPPAWRRPAVTWVEGCRGPRVLTATGEFHALGETHPVNGRDAWNDARRSDLWLYNLHYFDDLNAVDAAARGTQQSEFVARWIAENPPAIGTGWRPYPLSRRIINWIRWKLADPGRTLPPGFDASLAVQARWLAAHLERHIGGNHLLANAKALVFAGLVFEGGEADGWFELGQSILLRELDEQVLPDGGHYELSPLYHAAVLEDLLDTANVLRVFSRPVPEPLVAAISRMLPWLRRMAHPDGEIAFFNDAAIGIAPVPAALTDYARRLRFAATPGSGSMVVLRDSGYVRAELGAAVLLCDVGAVGPDHLPGHAHADTLSFELSLGGERFAVNTGTSVYGNGPERQRQRGTAAHNTVSVEDADSSEVWGGFRVARRARATLLEARESPDGIRVAASHDGYRRLRAHGEHRRKWHLQSGGLVVADEIGGTFDKATARLYFHPGVELRETGGGVIDMRRGAVRAMLSFEGARHVRVLEASWHPRFGQSVPNLLVEADFAGARMLTHFSWSTA
jgi:uncharacterized heparinase superfamily protein